MSGSRLAAPSYKDLPVARPMGARDGPERESLAVRLEVVTPILGGAAVVRQVDDVDFIRPASIRGHLRFWWRALNGHCFGSSDELYKEESALWGRAADDDGGRSEVEVQVSKVVAADVDSSPVVPAMPGGYALWPARVPPAPRRNPGTRFLLTLTVPADTRKAQVESALRAWLLFGGYGSRTRRGLGSCRVVDDAADWLPREATLPSITQAFDRNIFLPPGRPSCDVPWLAGAALHVGPPIAGPEDAWTTALNWLRDFRQGTANGPCGRARQPGFPPQPNRPSISNWPEPDKIRHLTGRIKSHPPRHNATPVWPRAGFGLPILGRFQDRARGGGHMNEPDRFELCWRDGHGAEHERLASPLIVKAMPLASGQFAPCALWLNRAYPRGEVVLQGNLASAAPFDQMVAAGDTPRFAALAGKLSLREAFLNWLSGTCHTTVVAP